MIDFIVYLITNCIIIFILLSYLHDKYVSKRKKIFFVLSFILYSTGISLINIYNISILNLTCNLTFFIFIDFIGYQHKSKFEYFNDVIYFFLLIFLDSLTYFLIGFVYSYNNIEIFRAASSLAIILFCNMIVRRYISITKIENVPFKEIMIYLTITIFYVFTIYILSYNYDSLENKVFQSFIIFFVIGQIAINVIIYYYLNFVGLSYQMEKKKEKKQQQLEIKKVYYTNLKKSYDEHRKIIHDIKNYIQILEDAYKTNQESADRLKKQLDKMLDKNKMKYQTSSDILDIILIDKENEANKKNIDFIFRMEILDLSFISELDVITIFCNLYDNAIEGNENVNNKKYIITNIYKIGEMIIIRVENSCKNQLKYVKNKIKSTKQGHQGIGINNIKSTIDKYGGVCDIEIINGKCNFIISIPSNKEIKR